MNQISFKNKKGFQMISKKKIITLDINYKRYTIIYLVIREKFLKMKLKFF